jgi:hypothetical protein
VEIPNITIRRDGTFSASAVGSNVNNFRNTAPAGAVATESRWEVYLKAKGRIEGDVVRVQIDHAIGSGTLIAASPSGTYRTDIRTSPDSDTQTVFVRGPGFAQSSQSSRAGAWHSQEWKPRKLESREGWTKYFAVRDLQMRGGLLLEEGVCLEKRAAGPDLKITFVRNLGTPIVDNLQARVDGDLQVEVQVENIGSEVAEASELAIWFKGQYVVAELLDSGVGLDDRDPLESSNESVTLRLGRLAPREFANATARFRIRVSPDEIDTDLVRVLRTHGTTGTSSVSARVTNSRDINQGNNTAEKLVDVLPASKR